MTLSDMTDSDLLLDVARMKFPDKEITANDAGRLFINCGGKFEPMPFNNDPNTIHPLWAEYAERYKEILRENGPDKYWLWKNEKHALDKAFQASQSERGMLEAVWTVLSEERK